MILPAHPEAQREFDRATKEYEDIDPRLALRFIDAIDRAIESVARNPKMYPIAEDAPEGFEVRNYLVHRFPYRVVYWMAGDRTVILAYPHHSREPGYWQNRLSHDIPPEAPR